jgi:hypothetical protein
MRPNTPPSLSPAGGQVITVKMCCERCGREVGDANQDELAAAVLGESLPSVVDECGCLVASLAVLTVADHCDDTDIPLESAGSVTFQCFCGETYTATPEVSWEEALHAHQVEAVRTVLRENRA